MAAPTRFVALFGPRNCGKTVYLGALYGSSSDGGAGTEYHVASDDDPDDPTHRDLGRVRRDLTAGTWPRATEFDALKPMTLAFTVQGAAYRVVLPDVGGELTARPTGSGGYELATRELKERILREYQDYHGFLVFVPATPGPGQDRVEAKWEVDVLLQALKERTPDGGLIARPVAVILSKWDMLGPIAPGDAEAQAAEFFRKAYPELAAGLAATCKNLRVFPVSSTGRLVDGRPPVPLAPFNLGAPLGWLLRTSDEVLLERLEARLADWQHRLFRRDVSRPERPTYFRRALEEIEQFLADVPNGPLADVARQRLRELRSRRGRRRVRLGAIAMALLVVMAGSFGAVRDHDTYRSTIRLIEAKGDPRDPGELLRTTDAVLAERWHVMGRMLGWWGDLASRRDGVYRDREAIAFAELERLSPPDSAADAEHIVELAEVYVRTFPASGLRADVAALREAATNYLNAEAERRDYAGITEQNETFLKDRESRLLANALLENCTQYLETHKGGMHVPEVQRIKADVEVALIRQKQASDLAELDDQLAKAAGDPYKCFQLCTKFLAQSPQHPQASRVQEQRGGFLKEADEQAWESVLAFARDYPNDYAGQIQRANILYTSNTLFQAHRTDVAKFLATAQRGLDRSTYEEIRARARGGSESAILDDVRRRCREYLDNAAIPDKVMAGEVEAWLKWFDSWAQGKDFYVDVASVQVNKGSQWHYTLYWPTVRVEVRVGGSLHATGRKVIDYGTEERGLPSRRLGPFHWKWNDPGVAVSLGWENASPPVSLDLSDDPFGVRYLNRRIDFDGGRIAVRLECPDVVPPPLSPYRER